MLCFPIARVNTPSQMEVTYPGLERSAFKQRAGGSGASTQTLRTIIIPSCIQLESQKAEFSFNLIAVPKNLLSHIGFYSRCPIGIKDFYLYMLLMKYKNRGQGYNLIENIPKPVENDALYLILLSL